MKKSLTAFVLLFTLTSLYGQNEDNYWIFGMPNTVGVNTPITLDFSSSITSPDPEPGTFANSIHTAPNPNDISSSNNISLGLEGTVVATHPLSGELLFYTDGDNVYDKNHNDITPSGGLGGHKSSGQPAAVCWNPDNSSNSFYIFSNPTSTSPNSPTLGTVTGLGPITFRIYNIDNGTFSQEYQLPTLSSDQGVSPNVSEGLLVISNPIDENSFWLITHIYGTNTYRVYPITTAGIDLPVEYSFGPSYPDPGVTQGVGSFTFHHESIRGNFGEFAIGTSGAYSGTGAVLTNGFDATTGIFQNNVLIASSGEANLELGVEFSPNGRYLYYSLSEYTNLTNGGIYQYDILSNTSTQVVSNLRTSGMKLGPDEKLYFNHWSGTPTNSTSTIGRILNPNESVANLQTELNYYSQAGVLAGNLPEFVVMPRSSLSIEDFSDNSNQFLLFPSPAIDRIQITSVEEMPGFVDYQIIDRLGKDIISGQVFSLNDRYSIDVSQLASGIYTVIIKSSNSVNIKAEFIKE